MSTYFSQAFHDFERLGLINAPAVIDAFEVYALVQSTHSITDAVRPSRRPRLATDIGSAAYTAMGTTKDTDAGGKYFTVCEEAEATLSQSLQRGNGSQTVGYPPVIYTLDAEPVAVTKGLGERTTYVLKDVRRLGLIAKTYAMTDTGVSPKVLPPTDVAYTIELGRGVMKGTHFKTLRFALMATPTLERRRINPACYGEHFVLDHEAITRSVGHLACEARPLEQLPLSEAMYRTAENRRLKEQLMFSAADN